MALGSRLTSAEQRALDRTIYSAELSSRIEFSVFVGDAEGEPRPFATRLHNTLLAPARSVLIMVDPERRLVEVVTGGDVRRRLSDKQVELAVAAMQSQFAEGNLCDGIVRGVNQLAEHAG